MGGGGVDEEELRRRIGEGEVAFLSFSTTEVWGSDL